MGAALQRVILVTHDDALADIFKKACERRKMTAECVKTATEARARWYDEESQLVGVVGDSSVMNPQAKYQLLQFHCEPGAPRLIVLDPPQVPDPRAPIETVTRLRWPLNAAFVDALKEIQVPMVFLTDSTLYLTGMLQARLQSIGLKTYIFESATGLSQTLQSLLGGEKEAPAEGGGFWSRLSGKKAEEEAPAEGGVPPCAIVLWKGDAFDAQPVHQRVTQTIPEARMFLVTSSGAVHNAERALRKMRPAFMPRDLIENTIDVFTTKINADPMGLGRVLLVDNFKPQLIQLSTSLMAEGYEVLAHMSAEEAMEELKTDHFHIAVVGAAIAFAQHTGVELAQKMRELDPDLRLILMVDRYPLQSALQGVSQVVEVGLDDCLLKPVEPSRLRFSISRALERRRLLLENKRLLDELKVANEELEQLTGFQKKFFATVAHDVKNPLTAIRGYAELLSWKIKDQDLMKCVTHIQSSSKTLEGLISDLVDFAAIESGKLRVNMAEMDLLQVANEVSSRIQVAANNRQIQFKMSLPESLPKLSGDPLRIGQVIQNLCTNGIQYTCEKGAVYLKIEQGPSLITVSVRDTGIGISKEDLPRIFQRFFQAENAQKMRRAGFGLGLKIAQEIVKAHGGGMGVDSELGKGSVFYSTLPLTSTPTQTPAQAGASAAPAAPGAPPKPPHPGDVPAIPGMPSMQGPHTPMPRRLQTPPPKSLPEKQ